MGNLFNLFRISRPPLFSVCSLFFSLVCQFVVCVSGSASPSPIKCPPFWSDKSVSEVDDLGEDLATPPDRIPGGDVTRQDLPNSPGIGRLTVCLRVAVG